MNCVSEDILWLYQDGELGAMERREVESHLASCASCAKRLQEMAATSAVVSGCLSSLDAGAADTSVDPSVALARFKAQQDAAVKPAAFLRMFDRRWRPAWVTAVAATIILGALAFPSGRSMAQRFLATLRIEKVQPVRLDFSALDGNRPMQEMLRQMVSDKVVVTADEKPQHVDTANDASQLAGFPARLLSARTDAPKFTVEGQHAFHMTIDRSRLQDIFDQAGRPDLLLPATIDGAAVSVNVPRSLRLEYGNCPHAHPTAEEKEAQGETKNWSDCVGLIEAPSPQVHVPSDLNIRQLAEIGFQLSGMNATQARELGQTIDWKSTLVLPMPRHAGTFSQVTVAGTQGTLITSNSGRRGPDYVVIWVKNGIIYGLVGQGDASNAVALANSLN